MTWDSDFFTAPARRQTSMTKERSVRQLKRKIVIIPSINEPIKESPGFAKKGLSDYKLDILGLCEFGCAYCSSNRGNYLRIRQEPFADLTEEQLGERTYPGDDPDLMFVWPDVLEKLMAQLEKKPRGWGSGRTLVFSMLTDGFSPLLVQGGVTETALRMVLDRTAFRIRVLTKNAVVGSDRWINFFKAHPGRFIVGLSTGTLDDDWAKQVEVKTSLPSARLRALANLQREGVPTFGMLCPIFPDVLESGRLEELVDSVNPGAVEDLWAEPFNNRDNWEKVRDAYPALSHGYRWLTQVYGRRDWTAWSAYATELYVRLKEKAVREGWISKLKFLLYEDLITEQDAPKYRGMRGLLLQSQPGPDGYSRNPLIAYYQRQAIIKSGP